MMTRKNFIGRLALIAGALVTGITRLFTARPVTPPKVKLRRLNIYRNFTLDGPALQPTSDSAVMLFCEFGEVRNGDVIQIISDKDDFMHLEFQKVISDPLPTNNPQEGRWGIVTQPMPKNFPSRVTFESNNWKAFTDHA